MSGDKRVFVKFLEEEILSDNGRYLFSLLYSFLFAGYEVQLFGDIPRRFMELCNCVESELPPPARLVLSLDKLVFADRPPANPQDYIYLFDKPDKTLKRLTWRKRIKVSFDLFSAYRWRRPVIAPFSVHPTQAQWTRPQLLREFRVTPRRLRVLFAGDSGGYKRNRVRYPKPKLPRLEVLATLVAGLGDDVIAVQDADHFERLRNTEFTRKFVLSDSGSGVENRQWMSTMAKADFFLCPPGIVMPMCHNVIEAMAVGTIPLINYPEWLHPNLTHLENCLVFDGNEDLIGKMRLALAMDESQINRMRSNVIKYYDSYLQPDAVVKEVETREEHTTTLLMYTELNSKKFSSKLNRNSVLMRGPDSAGELRWFTSLTDRYLSLALKR